MNPKKICSNLIAAFAGAEKNDLLRAVPVFSAFGFTPLDVVRIAVSVALQAPCDVNTFGGFSGSAHFRLALPYSLESSNFESLVDEFYSFFENPALTRIFRAGKYGSTDVYFSQVAVESLPEPASDEADLVFEVDLKIAGQIISPEK